VQDDDEGSVRSARHRREATIAARYTPCVDARSVVRLPVRVDLAWVALVALLLAGLTALVVPLWLDVAVPVWVKGAVGAMWLGAVGLTLGVALPLRYELEPEGLTVRAGLLTLRLAYRDIVRVDRLVSPLTAPAWSPIRLRVYLDGGGWVEVAPRDREALLAELAARAPHLRATTRGLVDGARARRATSRSRRGERP
jgi:hypothetical protein